MGRLRLHIAAHPWITLAAKGCSLLSDEIQELRREGAFIAEVDGRLVDTREALFREFAAALQFPSYFGGNWGALEECLGDVYDSLKREVVVVLVANSEKLLSGTQADFKIMVEVFVAAASWIADPIDDEFPRNRPGVSLHFVLEVSDGVRVESMIDRMRSAGIARPTYSVLA